MAADHLPAPATESADSAARVDWRETHDSARPGPGRAPGLAGLPAIGSRPARRFLISVVVLGCAWFAGGSAPFSTRALVSVLIPGAVLGAIAYGRPPQRIPAPESIDVTGFSCWIVALALLFEWEASAVRDGSPWWHPSLTELINPLLTPHSIKSAAFAVWLLAGWGLVKR